MTETRDLIKLKAITDFETPIYHIGEVDFEYNEEVLTDHIKRYGVTDLASKLSYMQYVVWRIKIKLSEEDQQNSAQGVA